MKKYELTAEFIEQWGKKLFRIKALISLSQNRFDIQSTLGGKQ